MYKIVFKTPPHKRNASLLPITTITCKRRIEELGKDVQQQELLKAASNATFDTNLLRAYKRFAIADRAFDPKVFDS
jgi:hypothetical protein